MLLRACNKNSWVLLAILIVNSVQIYDFVISDQDIKS